MLAQEAEGAPLPPGEELGWGAGLLAWVKAEPDNQSSVSPCWLGDVQTPTNRCGPHTCAKVALRGHYRQIDRGLFCQVRSLDLFFKKEGGVILPGQHALKERKAEIFLPQPCNPAPGPQEVPSTGEYSH